MKKTSRFARLFVAMAVVLSMVCTPMTNTVSYAANENDGVSLASIDTTSVEGVTVESEETYFEKPGTDIPLSVKVTTERAMEIGYQWYVGNEMIEGATEASYTVPKGDVESSSTYKYSCVVTVTEGDFVGHIQRDFKIKIASTLNCVYGEEYDLIGDEITIPVLAVSSLGADAITYEWYTVSDEYDAEEDEWVDVETPIKGVTGNKLTVKATDFKPNSNVYFACVVSDGKSTRRCKIEVYYYPISIDEDITYFSTISGKSVTLSLEASSKDQSELSYQWYEVKGSEYDEVNEQWNDVLELIEGATGPSCVVSKEKEGEYEFKCAVSSKTVTVWSDIYSVYVGDTEGFSLDYERWMEVRRGEKATLSVTSSKEDVNYQWYILNPELDIDEVDRYELENYVPIEGATQNTYVAETAKLPEDAYFVCVVTDQQDEYNCQNAYINVEVYKDLHAYIETDGDSVILINRPHTFYVQTSADPDNGTLKYQWLIDDEKIEGATESTFTYTFKEDGQHWISCIVSNDVEEKEDEYYARVYNFTDSETISKDSVKEISLEDGEYKLYSFTPETTGTYSISSKGSGDPVLEIFDSSYLEYGYSDDDADSYMFDFADEFTAGKTYYLLVRAYGNFDGTVTLLSADASFKLYNRYNEITARITDKPTLTVKTDKTEGLTYRWYLCGYAYEEGDIDEPTETKFLIRDAKTASLTIDPTDADNYYVTYVCEVSDGKYTKTAKFFVEYSSFSLKQNSYDLLAKQNEQVTLKTEAEGDNLTYQWYKPVEHDEDGFAYDEMKGETGPTLSTKIVFFDGFDYTHYYCVVSDGMKWERVWFYIDLDVNHDWQTEYTVDVEPTCTEEGSKSIHCNDCNQIKDIETIPALGHKYGEWHVVQPSTCLEKGFEQRECSVCGENEERELELADHVVVIDPAKAPTCTEPGLTEGQHCGVCGDVIKEQTEVPATGHKFGEWHVVQGCSCEEGGNKERVCSVCGFTELEEFAPSGHVWDDDYTVDVPATCTTDGSKSIHCKNCDVKKESQVIPATGHTPVVDPAVDATVFEPGLTEGTHCSVCGEVLVPQEELPTLTKTIKLSATKKTIKKKKSYTLKISNLALGDSVKSVTSSKKTVATVKKVKTNQYKITAKKKGKATITVTLKSGKKKTCKITVK